MVSGTSSFEPKARSSAGKLSVMGFVQAASSAKSTIESHPSLFSRYSTAKMTDTCRIRRELIGPMRKKNL